MLCPALVVPLSPGIGDGEIEKRAQGLEPGSSLQECKPTGTLLGFRGQKPASSRGAEGGLSEARSPP